MSLCDSDSLRRWFCKEAFFSFWKELPLFRFCIETWEEVCSMRSCGSIFDKRWCRVSCHEKLSVWGRVRPVFSLQEVLQEVSDNNSNRLLYIQQVFTKRKLNFEKTWRRCVSRVSFLLLCCYCDVLKLPVFGLTLWCRFPSFFLLWDIASKKIAFFKYDENKKKV